MNIPEKAAKLTAAMQTAIGQELNSKARASMREFLKLASETTKAKLYDLILEFDTPAEAIASLQAGEGENKPEN